MGVSPYPPKTQRLQPSSPGLGGLGLAVLLEGGLQLEGQAPHAHHLRLDGLGVDVPVEEGAPAAEVCGAKALAGSGLSGLSGAGVRSRGLGGRREEGERKGLGPEDPRGLVVFHTELSGVQIVLSGAS